ncbi:hypothetical protein GCM10027344_00100 [Spelaeicoccus albus]
MSEYGSTYAQDAGITVRDKPAPLYRLLVLALLLSARIGSDIAVAGARELFASGYRTPQKMRDAGWKERVAALGRAHYRRYDERASTALGNGATMLIDEYGGDLRKLRLASTGREQMLGRLQEFPGIGPTGSSIFCREVQAVWPELAPFADRKVQDGAERLGLPGEAAKLGKFVESADMPRLAAGCVRAALHEDVADAVLRPSGDSGTLVRGR